jgi:transcription-repair coupling factor (superfamily II helicase)
MVIPSIAADQAVIALKKLLAADRGVVHVSGLWGSSAPMLAAYACTGGSAVWLYVTAHLEEADHARDDIELFLGRSCELLPAWDTLPGEGPAAGEILAERIRLCTKLQSAAQAQSRNTLFVVAPIQALQQPLPAPGDLKRNTLRVSTESTISDKAARGPLAMLEWLIDRGYERLDRVESPGDVAVRGDIVDVFVPGDVHPIRIQFFDDQVESLRRFDISSQRSIESLSSVSITAVRMDSTQGEHGDTDLFDYLPAQSRIVLDSPTSVQEMGQTFHSRMISKSMLFDTRRVFHRMSSHPQLHITRLGGAVAASDEASIHFDAASLVRFEGAAVDTVAELGAAARDRTVHVLCDNDGERQRLRELLRDHSIELSNRVELHLGMMHRGFEWVSTKTIVVSHHELFHRERQRRRIRRVQAGSMLESFTELSPGELVVHLSHGIAMYRGLKAMRKGDARLEEEFLTLEFAEQAIVHVPVSQIDLVQKYIGVPGRKPKLSTLGGKRWSKTKEQVAAAVSDFAETLLRVQAKRDAAIGTAYPADTEWQREFEASFPYDETEDQLLVADEIRGDLTRQRPMDRLICGDVGYGKTELAMRAAFKVIEYGRQTAVLVPTTVLAEQHYATFRERMADYPFGVGCLSRFRTAGEQKKIIEQARKGQIDVVIGTHRLLSKDVSFANLGLVIIDEEQRFGVEHKERLKQMRETVDVLTLTATPIPRTLHMSLSGLRDISTLQTPPVDRRSIGTQVRPFDDNLIRDAILRELNRDGQVYFVHNFVQSIAAMADAVRRIVPEARVVYGHGQMGDHELEGVMHKFLRREADVLVATTIIESGIDIPSANTIFINRADRFGLADLHQLRGRVGRSHHRAYCYLLLSPDRPLTGKAAKRLKTIEEFSELGAGFRIAMRDLEIRGAGNLLGKEQSGHIGAVGYDLYCRMLEKTVRRLKNEPDPCPPPLNVDLDVAACVPPNYVDSDRSRIDIYRRITVSRTIEELNQLEKDLLDAYGAYPKPVERLLQLAEIRVLARAFGVTSISLRPPDVVFLVDNVQTAEPLFKNAPGTARMPDHKTVHLRLPPNYLETNTLLPVLRRMLLRAGEKAEATAP